MYKKYDLVLMIFLFYFIVIPLVALSISVPNQLFTGQSSGFTHLTTHTKSIRLLNKPEEISRLLIIDTLRTPVRKQNITTTMQRRKKTRGFHRSENKPIIFIFFHQGSNKSSDKEIPFRDITSAQAGYFKPMSKSWMQPDKHTDIILLNQKSPIDTVIAYNRMTVTQIPLI